MNDAFDGNRTQQLDRAACLALLASTSLGRVAVTVDALPAVVPVPYVLAGEAIVFACTSDAKVRRGLDGGVVGFQTDGLDRRQNVAWSVLVQGFCSLRIPTDRAEVFPDQGAWIGPTVDCIASVGIDRITGWRRDAGAATSGAARQHGP